MTASTALAVFLLEVRAWTNTTARSIPAGRANEPILQNLVLLVVFVTFPFDSFHKQAIITDFYHLHHQQTASH